MFEINTSVSGFSGVGEGWEEMGYTFLSAEVAYVPDTYTRIEDEENRKKMSMLIEMMEDNDDISDIWHNWENEDEE